MELFVETRLDLNPDPEFDPISCIFYTVFHDAPNSQGLTSGKSSIQVDFYGARFLLDGTTLFYLHQLAFQPFSYSVSPSYLYLVFM